MNLNLNCVSVGLLCCTITVATIVAFLSKGKRLCEEPVADTTVDLEHLEER